MIDMGQMSPSLLLGANLILHGYGKAILMVLAGDYELRVFLINWAGKKEKKKTGIEEYLF